MGLSRLSDERNTGADAGAGVAVERDTPTRLLEDKSSLFSKLVAEYTMRSTHT